MTRHHGSVSTHDGLAPEAAPVLQPTHAATVLVAHHAFGTDRQVSFQPLVRHEHLREKRKNETSAELHPAHLTSDGPITHPFLVLDDVVSYGGQRGPFAVVGGADCTALMSLELTNCRGHIDEGHVRQT